MPQLTKEVRQLVDQFVKQYGDKYVWQVDVALATLAEAIEEVWTTPAPPTDDEEDEEDGDYYRWAVYADDSDEMLEHDTGYENLEDAVKDAEIALAGMDAKLAYIEITDEHGQADLLVSLHKDHMGKIIRENI